MRHNRMTIADLRACKGKRQLSMLYVENTDEAAAANALSCAAFAATNGFNRVTISGLIASFLVQPAAINPLHSAAASRNEKVAFMVLSMIFH